MMSLRTCVRSAPRALGRISSRVVRPQATSSFTPVLSASWRQAATSKAIASFHTSVSRKDEVTTELVAVLNQELSFEESNISENETENYSNIAKDFLANSNFKLVDSPGQDEATLTRTYNDENITVKFNIIDLIDDAEGNAYDDQAMFDEEEADASEIMDSQTSGGGNTKGAVNQGRTADGNIKVAPEDRVAPADRPELEEEEFQDEEEAPTNFPARVSIKIERPSKGAIAIDAIAQDGQIAIENVYYFNDTEHADPSNPSKDLERRNLYTGPKYASLDPNVQAMFEKYLEDRGIDSSMALFIPDYIEYKENREYIGWLKNMKNFWED